MKTLKRVTSLFLMTALVFTSVFSSIGYAAVTFTDVESGYIYENAIYRLSNLGIINGYANNDGTFSFKPNDTITRAEVAKLIVAASIGEDVVLTDTSTPFSDVDNNPNASWAIPYISQAVKTSVIIGYEDGTFRPDNTVTYAEVVKMIVCTLGYKSTVAATEPWYDGYITAANRIGITSKAIMPSETGANRGIVAQLINNMLDANPMVQIGINNITGEPIYEVNRGETFYESISSKRSYSGQLMGVFNNTITGSGLGLTKNQIMVDGMVFDLRNYSGTDLSEYLGYGVDVTYITDDLGNTNELVKIEKSKDNVEYNVDSSQLDLDATTGSSLKYYKNEGDSKTTTLPLNKKTDLAIFYNGNPVNVSAMGANWVDKYLLIEDGSLNLLDYDNDGIIDVVFVREYITYFVESVVVDDDVYTIYDKYNQNEPFVIDTYSDTQYTIKKISSDFKSYTTVKLSATAIPKNSIISVGTSSGLVDKVEIIISTNTVTGKISELSSGGDIKIGTNSYKTSAYYDNIKDIAGANQAIELGLTGTYYLDCSGRITAVNITETTLLYGYVTLYDSSISSTKQNESIMMVKATNKTPIVYTFSKKVNVNGKSMTDKEAAEMLKDAAEFINDNPNIKSSNSKYSCLIKYGTTVANGTEINKIQTIGDTDKNVKLGSKARELIYNSSSKAFYTINGDGSQGDIVFTINTKTSIMAVPEDRSKSTYAIYSYTHFKNGSKYLVESYDLDASDCAAMVIEYSTGEVKVEISADSVPIIIKDKSETLSGIEFTYIEIGGTTQKTITVEEGSPADAMAGDIEIGDIIRYSLNSGMIYKIEKLVVGGEMYDIKTQEVSDTNVVSQASGSNTSYYKAMYGTVLSVTEDAMMVTPHFAAEVDDKGDILQTGKENFTLGSSVAIMEFDRNNSKVSTSIPVSRLQSVSSIGKDAASKVLVVSMADNVIGIVIFK